MKLFECQGCAQVLHFHNTRCGRCTRVLGFLPGRTLLTALDPAGEAWRTLARPRRTLRFCANAGYEACNWLLEDAGPLCVACRFNRAIPDLSEPGRLALWRKAQMAKHQLFYALLRLRLPLQGRDAAHPGGLAFDVLADAPEPDAPKVMTGHDNGLITLALEEADDAERERRRTALNEPYRTLLGHFRHEIGHYYWDVLVHDDPARLDACRALFGDERAEYGAALERHYRDGPPAGWGDSHVSAYAAVHPWEDWAETWAHYLHIVDTLEVAAAYGMSIRPDLREGRQISARIRLDPYGGAGIAEILAAWVPLSLAMNSLNRAMGSPDPYPFVLPPPVVAKLGFVHQVIHAGHDQSS